MVLWEMIQVQNNLGVFSGRLKVFKEPKAGSVSVFNFLNGRIRKNLNEKQVEHMKWKGKVTNFLKSEHLVFS